MEQLMEELRKRIDEIPDDAQMSGAEFKEIIEHVVGWCEMEIGRAENICKFRLMVAKYEKERKE